MESSWLSCVQEDPAKQFRLKAHDGPCVSDNSDILYTQFPLWLHNLSFKGYEGPFK